MIDIHPSTHPASTWREFFIHIATIVLGLLIAVGLEQTVEYFHHRHQASEARASIQQELRLNAGILRQNSDNLAAEQLQLAKDMDALDSAAADAKTLAALQYSWYLVRPLDYSWYLVRPLDTAWNAAKTNGSIALIPSQDIEPANYLYSSNTEFTQLTLSYFADMETAAAIVDHARIAGKLDQAERDQLRALTATAIGQARLFAVILPYQLKAAQGNTLNR